MATELIMMETSLIEEEILDLNNQIKQLDALNMAHPRETGSRSIMRMVTPTSSHNHQNQTNQANMNPVAFTTKEVGYWLNMEKALAKILKGCDRIMYKSESKTNCTVITLSTAGFEFFKGEVLSYLKCQPEYAVTVEHLLDNSGNITQAIVMLKNCHQGR